MKIKLLALYMVAVSACFTACQYDNFEAPKSILSGKIIHNGTALQIRNNGPELELWQDGFALYSKINVYVDQNGHFSAQLFDGQYKLTRLSNAPWLHQPKDTIIVNVKGNTTVDVPVTPYFNVQNASASYSNNIVKGDFEVSKILESAQIDDVKMFISTTNIVDNVNNEQNASLPVSALVFGNKISITTSLRDDLVKKTKKININHLFVRIGVKSKSAGEYNFSNVLKVDL